MRIRNPREINETLSIMGFPVWALAAAIFSVPVSYMSFDILGMLIPAGIISLGVSVTALPRGIVIHKLYRKGVLGAFIDNAPDGPTRSFRE